MTKSGRKMRENIFLMVLMTKKLVSSEYDKEFWFLTELLSGRDVSVQPINPNILFLWRWFPFCLSHHPPQSLLSPWFCLMVYSCPLPDLCRSRNITSVVFMVINSKWEFTYPYWIESANKSGLPIILMLYISHCFNYCCNCNCCKKETKLWNYWE